MKSGGAEDKNGGVNEESEAESESGIENGVAYGLAAVAGGGTEGASLDDAGMEIKIVRHDGGAEDANGDVQHFAIVEDFGGGDEADDGGAPDRMREKDFVGKASADGGDESDDESFDDAEAAALEGEDDQDVEAGDNHASEKGQAEKKLESNGGAENLGEVAGGDGDFADDPEDDGSTAGIMLAAGLGQIAAGGDAELRGKRLEKHGHEVAEKNDTEKGVAEFRAAADVGGPVAGVHIADGNEIAGTGKSEHFANPGSRVRDGNSAMSLGQRRQALTAGLGRGRGRSGSRIGAGGGFGFELGRK